MKFSCLMSIYKKDNPSFLKEAIESIVTQERIPDEFLIVKDGPLTKELDDILNYYSKKYGFINVCGYDQNKGLGFALNFGISKCKYDIVARMDSDDISIKERFNIQIGYLEKNPSIRVLGSNTNEFIDSIDNVISYRKMPETNDEIIKYSKTRCPFIHPSICFYKSDVLEVGNYSSNFYLCEDYDLWTRLISKGFKCYNMQSVLVFMRTSEDFYKRRGGLKYCKNILKFKKHLRKQRYMSFFEYFKTSIASLIVTLMPNFLRKLFYKKLLRNKQ